MCQTKQFQNNFEAVLTESVSFQFRFKRADSLTVNERTAHGNEAAVIATAITGDGQTIDPN